MHAGCRCSMKERRSLNSKSRILIMLPGDLTSTSSKNTHLLQGMGTTSSQPSLLQEATDFLQEVLYFYRKLPVEVQDGPESILWGDITTKDRFGRMQAIVISLAHCCHIVPPSLLTCNEVTCTSKTDRWVFKKKQLSNEKNTEISYLIHPSHPEALGAWSGGQILRRATCTQGGRTVTRHPAGVL